MLDQREFDKKLKAKRALFSKGRSMSLASFRLSSKLRKLSSSSPKKSKYWDKERDSNENAGPPRGELDFLNMDQLINLGMTTKAVNMNYFVVGNRDGNRIL